MEVMLITITYSVQRLVVPSRLQWWALAWRKCSENVSSPYLPGTYPNSDLRTLLLLLLSHFSHVQLCVIPYTAAHQAPLSLGFSRQEH